MKAAPIFDALTALHMVVSAKPTKDCLIPHALWLRAMQAEVYLRQALKDAGLEMPVEVEEVSHG